MEKNSGGPAFPLPSGCGDDLWRQGMSMRDYFAAAALHGFGGCLGINRDNALVVAEVAYVLADAMLKAREQ